MVTTAELENKIAELLDEFYRRRIAKIATLKLKDTLKRKNPYLYRAIGVQKAAEIVEEILVAYMSSSDEGIFGDAFFEPLAMFVSGGVVSPAEGVDVARESEGGYTAIAVKSGPSVFNAQSKKKQALDFKALENRLRKLQKHFDPIVGYCYGKKRQRPGTAAPFKELAGQAFWLELTGQPEFYLKIVECMQDKPAEHVLKYRQVFAAAVNRFTKEFIDEFCFEDGTINWEKLVTFNSGAV